MFRTHRPLALVAVALALVVSACGGSARSTSEPPPDTVTDTRSTIAGTRCEGTDPLFEGERSIGGQVADATTVADIGVRTVDGCTTVEVDLATDAGAPATAVGAIAVRWLRDVGVLRLLLDPSVVSTSVADRTFDDPRVDAAYVVRASDGTLWVDLHLAAPVGVVPSVDRGRIVLELVDGGDPYVAKPAVADHVVVLSPVDGRVSYPITVDGYARTFEATVVVRLYKSNRVEDEIVTQAADHIETWGAFTAEIPSGPNGRIELFVGEDSPEDGTEQGVRLSLVVN